MVKGKALLLGLFIFILLLYIGFSSAVCTSADTPKIKPINYFEVGEGKTLSYEFNVTNMPLTGVVFTYALFDEKLRGFSINNKGFMRFTPGSDAVGVSRIAIIAAKESCADTLIITIKVFDKPEIVYYYPQNYSMEINQSGNIPFKIRAEDTDANDTLSYEWRLDSEVINQSINKTSYEFKPGFKIFGVHEVSATVTDGHNLSETKTWYLQISRVNRAPVLVNNISAFSLFKNTASGAYNLNDYFVDPDGGKLRFEYKNVIPSFEPYGVYYANLSINIDKTGYVTYNPSLDSIGYAYILFTAYDIMNKSAESNPARVEVIGSNKFKDLNETSSKDFCGDYVCSKVEDCNTCPFDCGLCVQDQQTGCKPSWNCTEWDPCLPAGFHTRKCEDVNNCGDNRSKPDEVKKCVYNASCEDGLKNGIEEGVDCGGPCDACSSCNDSIQNQGEEGLDCGAPCENPCPNCFDNIKNQNESDVDCGGHCVACEGGKSCLKNKDCESLRCEYMTCTFASCDDSIKNQGELGIDCEGPCTKLCGNCTDKIQNAGEDGVDCGGKCKPCPGCNDNQKNGGETLVDCGGNCRKCLIHDYILYYSTLIIIIIVLIGFIPLGFISYIFFLFTNPDRARGLYDNNTSFAIIVSLNRFFAKIRKLRKKMGMITDDNIKKFTDELSELSKQTDGIKPLHDEIVRIYTVILGLPEEYDQNIFNMKLRTSSIPLFLKILFAGYYKKAEILVISSFIPPEEKADLIMELKFLLSEASKG
ncbi:hypothetical protein JW756_04190 [Candidatus Woesearchaeota archaeon]|nr:hypothetical protein [Candidatus Woesearchaeota archaeon]